MEGESSKLLNLTALNAEHQGNYTCQGLNEVGEGETSNLFFLSVNGDYLILLVKVMQLNFTARPEFITPLPEVSKFLDTETQDLECKVAAILDFLFKSFSRWNVF